MSPLQRVVKTLGVLGLVAALPALVSGQTTNYYAAQGGEYLPAGSLPGDQTHSSFALTNTGGFQVWQDNITDGDGLGISAVRLDGTFSPALGNFRVNQQGAFDQENPQVTLLQTGGAAFVWQGGKQGFQHIYARFLSVSNVWITGDVLVNTTTNKYQIQPAIATLANGNVIITWASFGQDNADGLQGVYGRVFKPTGESVTGEFPVNQFTPFNQRTPALAALPSGGFIVAWVSERQRSSTSVPVSGLTVPGTTNRPTSNDSVDIYAKSFNSDGSFASSEFLVNNSLSPCANPSVAVATDGTFLVAWSQKDLVVVNNSWDVFTRKFSAAGVGGSVLPLNTQKYGDQYAPRLACGGTDFLGVWTSLGQDGSRQGVFGQFMRPDGSHLGGEFRVNTTILNQQEFPAVASDGAGRFLVTWSSYVGSPWSMELNAQRYSTTLQPLSPPGAPFVTAVGSSRLSVTWPPVIGFNLASYGLYIDGSNSPVTVSNTMWTMSPLAPNAMHSFALDYLLTDGRRSPQSTATFGVTWGNDDNSDGLPDDWQAQYWGPNSGSWPPPSTHLGGPNGPTIAQIFQWGANPLDPRTWLTTGVGQTSQGWFFYWNTMPGSIYQVDTSPNFANWNAYGTPRFAAGTNDSVYIGLTNQSFYRVKRIRF